jgi:hypothetical protein
MAFDLWMRNTDQVLRSLDSREWLQHPLSPEYLIVKPCRISITRPFIASLSSIVVILKNSGCCFMVLYSLDLRLESPFPRYLVII